MFKYIETKVSKSMFTVAIYLLQVNKDVRRNAPTTIKIGVNNEKIIISKICEASFNL